MKRVLYTLFLILFCFSLAGQEEEFPEGADQVLSDAREAIRREFILEPLNSSPKGK